MVRNNCGWIWDRTDHLRSVREASEEFLGKFAADCLLSQAHPLDRIGQDLRGQDESSNLDHLPPPRIPGD